MTGHYFHFSVVVQGEGEEAWAGEPEQTNSEPFTLTVRAWSLSEACAKASATPLPEWTQPADDEKPDQEPSADQEKAWNEQYDGTSLGA